MISLDKPIETIHQGLEAKLVKVKENGNLVIAYQYKNCAGHDPVWTIGVYRADELKCNFINTKEKRMCTFYVNIYRNGGYNTYGHKDQAENAQDYTNNSTVVRAKEVKIEYEV